MKLTIEELAKFRAAVAELNGKSSEPWKDPDRDFIREAEEEVADALNYIEWEMLKRKDASNKELTSLLIAREYLRAIYELLESVKKK